MKKTVTREIQIVCCDQCEKEIPQNKSGYSVDKHRIDTWKNDRRVFNDCSIIEGSEKVLCLKCIKKFFTAEAEFIDNYFKR